MEAVFLCGGMGLRLRADFPITPKPLIQIGNQPIIIHIMKHYSKFGIKSFILCIGNNAQKFLDYFKVNITLDYKTFPQTFKVDFKLDKETWKITLAYTGLNTPTGGRIKLIEEHIQSNLFYCSYGDGISNISISNALEFHSSHNELATITVIKPNLPFGIIQFDNKAKINTFKEKPISKDWVNGGFFIFNKNIFDNLNLKSTLEIDLFPKLASQGKIFAYKHSGYWQCMDTYKDYIFLQEEFEQNNFPI